jgi:protein-disulfide isomerase
MASRKEQKDQARAARLAAERAAAAQAARQRRMMQLVGMVLAVAIVIVVVVVIASQSGGGLQHGKAASKTFQQVSGELAGIPQNGTTLGNPHAKITMVYFGDLECPICKAFTLGQDGGGFPQLVRNDVRQGKVKVVYKSFCTATCNGPGQAVFNTQQVAAYAAGKQNLFWDYADLFYREQGAEGTSYVNSSYLDGLAKQISGLNLSTWTKDRGDSSLLAQVQADGAQATSLGVSGTPTLVAEGPKGKTAANGAVPTYSALESAIKQVS